MKHTLFLLTMCAAFIVNAQDCNNYYYMQSNKTIEMSVFDKKGDISGKLVYSISDVKNTSGLTSATVQSQMFDKKGRTIANGNSVMKCNGGVMMINMKMTIPTPQAEQFKTSAKTDDFYLEYPANMSKGDQLKDGSMSMDVDNNGIPQSLSISVFDRKVEEKEKVTTAAGSWDCYKISYKSKMSIRIMGVGMPMNLDGTEWYAPNFGVVKSQSKHGSTEITSIK